MYEKECVKCLMPTFSISFFAQHRFSPSVEEDNFLNFYESTAMAAKISALIPSIMNDL